MIEIELGAESNDNTNLPTRRAFLIEMYRLGLGASVLSLIYGCGTDQPTAAKPVSKMPKAAETSASTGFYHGSIDIFSGLEYVSDAELDKLLKALEVTGHPLLNKVSSGIRDLVSMDQKQHQFPSWVDRESFPFAIVKDNKATTSISAIRVSKFSEDINYVDLGMSQRPQVGIDRMVFGIKLGLENTPLAGDQMQPAIKLAKEYLDILAVVALNEEAYDIAKKIKPDFVFKDMSGQEIIDPAKQKAVGMRFLLNILQDRNSSAWKVFDGFPMLMLGPAVRYLYEQGRLPNYDNVAALVVAANVYTKSSPETQKELDDFVDVWNKKGDYLFTAGSASRIFSEPLSSTVLNLENELVQAGLY